MDGIISDFLLQQNTYLQAIAAATAMETDLCLVGF